MSHVLQIQDVYTHKLRIIEFIGRWFHKRLRSKNNWTVALQSNLHFAIVQCLTLPVLSQKLPVFHNFTAYIWAPHSVPIQSARNYALKLWQKIREFVNQRAVTSWNYLSDFLQQWKALDEVVCICWNANKITPFKEHEINTSAWQRMYGLFRV